MDQFPCLGLTFLGMCQYDPAQPPNVYFTIGDAIAALGFTVAIQQLLKPVYLFRLQTYRLKLWYFILLVFGGFACTIVAVLVPHLSHRHPGFLGYPLAWELMGGVLIAIAYGATAVMSLLPARLYRFNLLLFVRAAANLLTEIDDDGRVTFARDLFGRPRNLAYLIRCASAWRIAEARGAALEFERLESIGAPAEIRGRPPITAFYRFAHRRELEFATYAGTFLRILSDPQFCSVLVCKVPWLTASMLKEVSRLRLHVDQAEAFVQEVGRQALINGQSMIAKEISYEGFGTVPELSTALFGDWFILHSYQPMHKMRFGGIGAEGITADYVKRLNGASRIMFETAARARDFWHAWYLMGPSGAYEHVFMNWRKERPQTEAIGLSVQIHAGMRDLARLTQEAVAKEDVERKRSLFFTERDRHGGVQLVNIVASVLYESIETFSNDFLGYDDAQWHHAIGIILEIYPHHNDEPSGMNPLQQQLAVKLIDRLKLNMDGWYPAISRVLLAVIGPYSAVTVKNRTAYVILRDAVYKQLQRLPALHANKPDKIRDYLPPYIIYDALTNTLTHTYPGGSTQLTQLSQLVIADVDLTSDTNWAA